MVLVQMGMLAVVATPMLVRIFNRGNLMECNRIIIHLRHFNLLLLRKHNHNNNNNCNSSSNSILTTECHCSSNNSSNSLQMVDKLSLHKDSSSNSRYQDQHHNNNSNSRIRYSLINHLNSSRSKWTFQAIILLSCLQHNSSNNLSNSRLRLNNKLFLLMESHNPSHKQEQITLHNRINHLCNLHNKHNKNSQ